MQLAARTTRPFTSGSRATRRFPMATRAAATEQVRAGRSPRRAPNGRRDHIDATHTSRRFACGRDAQHLGH
jgi:hypothetical protein